MSNTTLAVIASLSTLLTGAGVVALIQALARRRPTRVEAVVNLNESTYEWAQRIEASRQAERAAFDADREQFRGDIAEARREAREAREENMSANRIAHSLRLDLNRAQDELRACAAELAKMQVRLAATWQVIVRIREPGMTMAKLRAILDDADV